MVLVRAELVRMRMCGPMFGRGSGFTTCCLLIELTHRLSEGDNTKRLKPCVYKASLWITNYDIAITFKMLAFFLF